MFAKKNVKNIYALTPMQEGMLFQSAYNKESSAYFEQFKYRVSGVLDLRILEETWNEIIKRHDILRTVFVYKNTPQPLQIVLKSRQADFYFEDIRYLSTEEQKAYSLKYMEKDRERSFDLSKDMLMRFAVFQFNEKSFEMLWSFHHILLDGWSVGIIYEELAQIYNALSDGKTPDLKPAVPFNQYVRWLKKQDPKAAGNYWQEYLKGYEQLATLPRVNSTGDFDAEYLSVKLTESMTAGLERVASENHVTINTVFQVLWGILLGVYNDMDDVTFGFIVSGRPAEIKGIETMVGLFINAIPVRIRMAENQTFKSLLQKVHQDAIEAKSYHYYSLSDILAKTTLKNNLFDHILVFENYPDMGDSQDKFRGKFVIESSETFDHTHFDLSVQVYPGMPLSFEMIYNQLVFDRNIMEKIGEHFKEITEIILKNQNIHIKEIDILSSQEKEAYHANIQEQRKKLPVHNRIKEVSTSYAPPENEYQEKLAAIWKEIMQRDSIGIDDNYFELGGHSLLAMQILSRIHKEFETEIMLQEFLNNPNIRALSDVISKKSITDYADIEALPEQPHYELSHSQKRLWILDKLEENFIAYNLSAGYIFEGEFDVPAFQRAVQKVSERHESLRTTFIEIDGEPRQKIHQEMVMMKTSEVSKTSEVCQKSGVGDQFYDLSSVISYAKEESQRPFDLENGPLFRVNILKISENRHIVLLNIHHIIFDGWSFGILANEILEGMLNPDLKIPGLNIQYKDYAAWHNRLLTDDSIKAHKEYWHSKLGGELPVLNLPLDYPRKPVQTYNGNIISHLFSKSLTSDFKAFCIENEATLFMGLLSAVKILLFRYTAQDDIIIGSPVAGRNHPDLENQIGFYVNTLALRDNISGNESFKTLLSKVKQTFTEAYQHQIYPFDRLVEELNIQRDVSRSPIFDVMMVLQNDANVKLPSLPNLKISAFDYETGVSQFDLTMIFMETDNGELRLDINYNTDLFKADTVERMQSHIEELIKSIIRDQKESLNKLNILSESEKRKILVEFNDTAADYPKDKTLVDLFEEQVKKTPDNIALIFEDKQLTYKELNEAADKLADYLKTTYHIQPDDLIGVMAERGEQMIISLLGILKSGGAYLPIDPAYPKDRIDYMTEDSACKVVLKSDIESHQNPTTAKNWKPKANNLAYVIYTSGSTGKPKGVMIEHGGFVNMILAQISGFDISESDHVLQFASPSFDASLSEIFMALLKGAALVLIRKETIDDPEQFLEYISRHNVSVITFPPVYLNMLKKHPLPTVKTIITAGEPAIISDVLFYSKEKAYFNAYGPTETSVCTSFYRVKEVDPKIQNIPIGKPIANSAVFILDDVMNPVPIGVPGEICFSGVGLARGYLNRPELTAEKFIDEKNLQALRLYKIGDLARWLPDGNIEFLGRKDGQVKIRGYRIEVGEIESLLLQHPAIKEAVVIAKEDKQGDKRLIAYVVPEENTDSSLRLEPAIRKYLKEKLPGYMIPSAFVMLDKIPLTHNGKVDKKRLPDPADTGIKSDAVFIPPRDDIERKLVKIWQDILGTDNFGIQEDFFETGGHSLKIVQMASQIHKQLGIKTALLDIFTYSTIEALAKHLRHQILLKQQRTIDEKQSESNGFTPLVCIQNQGDKTPVFCVHPGGGNVLCYTELSRHLGDSQPFYAFQAFGFEPGTQPLSSVEDMAEKYIEALRTVQPRGPYILGGFCAGGTIAYEMARQLRQKGEKTSSLFILDGINYAAIAQELYDDIENFIIFALYFTGYPYIDISPFYCELRGIDPNSEFEAVYKDLQPLSMQERRDILLECACKAGILTSDNDMDIAFNVFSGIRQALHNYNIMPYDGDTFVFKAVDNFNPKKDNPTMGWGDYTCNLKVFDVPGDHHTMMIEPHVKVLAEKLRNCLKPLI